MGIGLALGLLFMLLAGLLLLALSLLRKIHQAVKLERDQAEQSRQTLITYVRVLSHEVRSPISAVLSNLGELRNHLSSPSQLRELALLEQAAQGASDVVENIVTINQPDGLQSATEQRLTRLADTIETCFRIVRFSNVNGVELTYDIEPNVPEKVHCDALRLSQILLNLLGNAIKFTLQGTVNLHVETVTVDKVGIVKFTVRDEGPGIPAAERDSVFQAYQLGSNAVVDGSQQSGLGLALVKKLVGEMGGTIEIESRVGVGSAFIVSLPLQAVHEEPSFSRTLSKSASAEKASQPSVLVAEDNEINQMIAQRMLEKLGCQVSVVSDGAQAVQRASDGNFDLVLMDLQMPKLNGVDACKQILVKMNHAPHIIAMTANVLDEERRRCIEAGMSDFLAKPVKLENLQTCLRKHGLSV
ncbi:MAG: response regulator [Pseudomonadota bacterium]